MSQRHSREFDRTKREHSQHSEIIRGTPEAEVTSAVSYSCDKEEESSGSAVRAPQVTEGEGSPAEPAA